MNIPGFPEAKTGGKKIPRQEKQPTDGESQRETKEGGKLVNRSCTENVGSAVCSSPGSERQAGRQEKLVWQHSRDFSVTDTTEKKKSIPPH